MDISGSSLRGICEIERRHDGDLESRYNTLDVSKIEGKRHGYVRLITQKDRHRSGAQQHMLCITSPARIGLRVISSHIPFYHSYKSFQSINAISSSSNSSTLTHASSAPSDTSTMSTPAALGFDHPNPASSRFCFPGDLVTTEILAPGACGEIENHQAKPATRVGLS